MEIEYSDWIKILMSVLCGSILGLEREYQNKSAGFRTIILICLGATLFTIVSQRMGGSDDRIAANIITGIGFIGAGVIFKDNLYVKGLTTAAVIWISAAIGMVIGISDYSLGFLLAGIVLVILSLFNRVEFLIDIMNNRKVFTIVFINTDLENLYMIETLITENKLKSRRMQVSKRDNRMVVTLEVSGNKKRMSILNEKLINQEVIYQV